MPMSASEVLRPCSFEHKVRCNVPGGFATWVAILYDRKTAPAQLNTAEPHRSIWRIVLGPPRTWDRQSNGHGVFPRNQIASKLSMADLY